MTREQDVLVSRILACPVVLSEVLRRAALICPDALKDALAAAVEQKENKG